MVEVPEPAGSRKRSARPREGCRHRRPWRIMDTTDVTRVESELKEG